MVFSFEGNITYKLWDGRSVIKRDIIQRRGGVVDTAPCIAGNEGGAKRGTEAILRINIGADIEKVGIADDGPVVTENIRENGGGGRL